MLKTGPGFGYCRGMKSLALLVLLAVLLALAAPAQSPEPPAEKVECCYTHPAYSGVCRVTPAPDETCESVFAYLNDPASSGKNYCDETNLRGGWKMVDCNPAPQPSCK